MLKGQKIYYNWLDIAKGIGIILVIVGHCIFPCHQIIDIFHMPLFFVISGLTFRHTTLEKFLISKIDRIGVPYVFWAILSGIISLIPHPYTGPFNGPLWFLSTIFTALIIMEILSNMKRKWMICLSFFLLILIAVSINNDQIITALPFQLYRSIAAYIYICIGFFFKDILLKQDLKWKVLLLFLTSGILFGGLFYYLFRYENFDGNFVFLTMFKHNFILVFICSLLGIAFTLYFSKFLNKNKILEYFGKNSLAIMCVHFPFAQLMNVYLSRQAYFQTLSGKLICGLIEYASIGLVSICLAELCKRFIPRLTGYKKLITA